VLHTVHSRVETASTGKCPIRYRPFGCVEGPASGIRAGTKVAEVVITNILTDVLGKPAVCKAVINLHGYLVVLLVGHLKHQGIAVNRSILEK